VLYQYDNTAKFEIGLSFPGISLVILNGAQRSEESLEYSIAGQPSRDFSLPTVAQNDIKAKVPLSRR
jgi:hypothetical protein